MDYESYYAQCLERQKAANDAIKLVTKLQKAVVKETATGDVKAACRDSQALCEAFENALEAMKAQASLGAQFLGGLNADAEASNADKVQPEANSGYADNGDPESKLIAGATALYNKMKGRIE